MPLERLTGTRYVVPLREGGSLPAVVETAEDGDYVVKFRGAGQGVKALLAEALVAQLALALDLSVPRPAQIELEDGFGLGEPDPEIQDLLRASVGTNFGLAYLPGSIGFDPVADRSLLSPEVAAEIVWLDAFVSNVDRTPRNTNLLVWQGRVWLIDHGAALYFHHRWEGWQQRVQAPFAPIKEHVLLPLAGDLAAADERLRPRLSRDVIHSAVATLPDDWLGEEEPFATLDEHRAAYVTYLQERLNGARAWLREAIGARTKGPERLGVRPTHRYDVD